MTRARELVRRGLDLPAVLDQVEDDAELISAGVSSGEMIRITLLCEGELGRALTDEELLSVNSIAAVAALLASEAPEET